MAPLLALKRLNCSLGVGQVVHWLPRILVSTITLPSDEVLQAPTPAVAAIQDPLHLELHSGALILQGYGCRTTWLTRDGLQLTAMEDVMDLPVRRQSQPPSFRRHRLHQLEGARPPCSQLAATVPQRQVLRRQPDTVTYKEGGRAAVAIRHAFHPVG